MRLTLAAVAVLVCVAPHAAFTATVPGASGGCIKGKIVGNATTYNPFALGWKSGGPGLATGGTYNPDGWEAALQTDLAKQYGCGYGSGKVCHAVVEGNGKSMIVQINDNGPMCADPATAKKAPDCINTQSRVIDLNQKSMAYMGDGFVENATVTLLCDFNNKLGPLDENERQAWMNRVFSVPADTSAAPLNQLPLSSQFGGFNSFGPLTGSPTALGTPSNPSFFQPTPSYISPQSFASPAMQPTSFFSSPAPTVSSGLSVTPNSTVLTTSGGTLTQGGSSADKLLALLRNPTQASISPVSSASPSGVAAGQFSTINTGGVPVFATPAVTSPSQTTIVTGPLAVAEPSSFAPQPTFSPANAEPQATALNNQAPSTLSSVLNVLRATLVNLLSALARMVNR